MLRHMARRVVRWSRQVGCRREALRQLPVERPGVAVAEGQAQPAGQVPLPAGHVRPAVDDLVVTVRPLAGLRNVTLVPHGSVRWATPTRLSVIA